MPLTFAASNISISMGTTCGSEGAYGSGPSVFTSPLTPSVLCRSIGCAYPLHLSFRPRAFELS